MKQYEAVISVMEANGGFATLGHLYRTATNVPGIEWKTKTPFASIRRIVQDPRFFFKIRPGLWALHSHRDRLPSDVFPKDIPSKQRKASEHSYYQGMLVEIGNLKHFHTAIPAQDRNRTYLNRKLGDVASVKEAYAFSYEHVIRRARMIDVLWFNERKMPAWCFEVEHTSDIFSSVLKFVELQDFMAKFYIVADSRRRAEFAGKMKYAAFSTIFGRTRFMSYDELSDWHAKTSRLIGLEGELGL